MTTAERLALEETIGATVDWLKASGVILPAALKRRDALEPGRRDKERAENKLFAILRRHWLLQRRKVQDVLEGLTGPPLISAFEPAFDDDEFLAKMMLAITDAVTGGVDLFSDDITLVFETSGVNQEALDWARRYSFELVKGVDNTTREALQKAIGAFIETPGMTIRDVVNLLPFSEKRGLLIAQTEITRAYAQGNQLAGEALKREFADVAVIKKWFTNRDDRVCPICQPLHGQEVPIDQPFQHPISGRSYANPGDSHVGCRCWSQVTTRILEPA